MDKEWSTQFCKGTIIFVAQVAMVVAAGAPILRKSPEPTLPIDGQASQRPRTSMISEKGPPLWDAALVESPYGALAPEAGWLEVKVLSERTVDSSNTRYPVGHSPVRSRSLMSICASPCWSGECARPPA